MGADTAIETGHTDWRGAMEMLYASYESRVPAPAAEVYDAIADYLDRHPRILPAAFTELVIEKGGVGAGTVLRYALRLGGRTRTGRMRVDEPAPGRVITETDLDTGAVTTFTVTSEGRDDCRVSIDTTWRSAAGVAGFFERLFAPGMLRKLYAEEVAKLAGVCMRGVPTAVVQ